jgi:hypothetical protein
MNKYEIFILDPLAPRHSTSHHKAVTSFLLRNQNHSTIFFPEAIFENKNHKFLPNRYLNKFRIFIFLIVYSVNYCTKYRRLFYKKTIFCPNVDYVTATVLLIARKVGVIDVKFIFRNIGILDNSTLPPLFRYLAKFILRLTLDIADRISSETKSLQFETQCLISQKIQVTHTPFPGFVLCQEKDFISTQDTFLFIGEPREDKGYLEVLKKVASMPNTHFRIQNPSIITPLFKSALEEISSCKNLAFFAQPKNDQEILDEISKSAGVLLPYSKNAFRVRGSAILTAAIIAKKTVISYREISFRAECQNFSEFVDWQDFTEIGLISNLQGSTEKSDYRAYVQSRWLELIS